MLQYLLSTGQMSTDHVAYQSLERLCLLALNNDRITPANRFAPLLEFATAQRNMFGAGCAHFMHGQGLADGATAEDPASFFALHNSWQHHADTIAANMPPADVPSSWSHETWSSAGTYTLRAVRVQPRVREGFSTGKKRPQTFSVSLRLPWVERGVPGIERLDSSDAAWMRAVPHQPQAVQQCKAFVHDR